jgi:hypothetical protein
MSVGKRSAFSVYSMKVLCFLTPCIVLNRWWYSHRHMSFYLYFRTLNVRNSHPAMGTQETRQLSKYQNKNPSHRKWEGEFLTPDTDPVDAYRYNSVGRWTEIPAMPNANTFSIRHSLTHKRYLTKFTTHWSALLSLWLRNWCRFHRWLKRHLVLDSKGALTDSVFFVKIVCTSDSIAI